MSELLIQLDEGILTLTLNRPEKLNALNDALLSQLSHVLLEAKTNPDVRGILITGEGKAFCAGADIARLAECDANSGFHFATMGQQVFHNLATLGKPSIAVVNGYAFGGGCELSIACSMRVASENAQFGQPEIKLGVIPGYGGTQRLARLIGKGRALDLCLTGRTINADTALSFGLVSHVFSPSELHSESKKLLQNIISLAPIALQSILDVFEYGYDLPLDNALHLEAVHFSKVCATKDKNEGVQAFLEKRRAVFQGA